MIIQPAARPPSTWLPTIAQTVFWAIPTIVSIFLLLRVLSLSSQFQHMQQSLDGYPSDVGSSWSLDPPIETLATAPPNLPSGQANWWFVEDTMTEGQPYAPEASSTTVAEPSLPSTTKTAIPTITPTASPDAQIMSLMPITNFMWPVTFEIPEELQHTLKVVLKGLGVFWQVCRKVYHYPLDPS